MEHRTVATSATLAVDFFSFPKIFLLFPFPQCSQANRAPSWLTFMVITCITPLSPRPKRLIKKSFLYSNLRVNNKMVKPEGATRTPRQAWFYLITMLDVRNLIHYQRFRRKMKKKKMRMKADNRTASSLSCWYREIYTQKGRKKNIYCLAL